MDKFIKQFLLTLSLGDEKVLNKFLLDNKENVNDEFYNTLNSMLKFEVIKDEDYDDILEMDDISNISLFLTGRDLILQGWYDDEDDYEYTNSNIRFEFGNTHHIFKFLATNRNLNNDFIKRILLNKDIEKFKYTESTKVSAYNGFRLTSAEDYNAHITVTVKSIIES